MKKINSITIARIGNSRTVKFAAEELRRYLKMMDAEAIVDIRLYDDYDENKADFLWLGLSDKLDNKLPAVKDKAFDDGIFVDVTDFGGVITGTNERSVLIAAYRFLRELGVVWLCPGECGETVPKRILDKCSVKVCEAATSRHRTICIEGSCGYEHLYNMIDWIPKAGMNGYFSQFHTPMGFLRRWYAHERNPYAEGVDFTIEDSDCIREKISEDVADRSLMYHMVGHGWTAEPLGMPSGGWDKVDESETPPEVLELLAMRDGKRTWNDGSPANTNLCFSNPKVIELLAKAIADYSVAHPELSHVAVWLADMRNNHCECDECRKSTPADLYINVLNRVDEVMTERGCGMKIIFISYNETAWAPISARIKNPDRFVLQFAPINRRFEPGEGYFNVEDVTKLDPVPMFELNKVLMPRTVKPIVRLMQDWLEGFKGDTCVFDYHLWSTTLDCDPGGMSIAEMTYKDMCDLERVGINGMVSCQVMRSCYPNGLAQTLMARGLWNNKGDYETEVVEYFADCYGSEWKTARAYLSKLSEIAWYWPHWDEKDVVIDENKVADYKAALAHIAEYKPIIEKIYADGKYETEAQGYFWNALLSHFEAARLICEMQIEKFSGKPRAERIDAELKLGAYYCEIEPEFHVTFDAWRQLAGLASPEDVENNH